MTNEQSPPDATSEHIAPSALNAGLETLAEKWRSRAIYLRGQSKKTLAKSGISKAMCDYAASHYEDRADELLRVLAPNA